MNSERSFSHEVTRRNHSVFFVSFVVKDGGLFLHTAASAIYRTSSMIPISGGESTRIGGPQVPAPRLA